jgi:hypothetical protein
MFQMFIAESESDHHLGLGILLPEFGDGGGVLQNIGRSGVEADLIKLTECEDQLDLLLPCVVIPCGELVDLESAKTATLRNLTWVVESETNLESDRCSQWLVCWAHNLMKRQVFVG